MEMVIYLASIIGAFLYGLYLGEYNIESQLKKLKNDKNIFYYMNDVKDMTKFLRQAD